MTMMRVLKALMLVVGMATIGKAVASHEYAAAACTGGFLLLLGSLLSTQRRLDDLEEQLTAQAMRDQRQSNLLRNILEATPHAPPPGRPKLSRVKLPPRPGLWLLLFGLLSQAEGEWHGDCPRNHRCEHGTCRPDAVRK